jgi:osmotically-inducible protein OsmY
VVTLAGTVDSYPAKFAATRAAERVKGVRGVANDIVVMLPKSLELSDTEIAHMAVGALRWDVEVPESVKVSVANGWLTLEGEVEWEFQRRAAARATANLRGLRGLSNLIVIRPRASQLDVSQRIKEALRRHAELDARHIEVVTHEGTVTLRGTVNSSAERRDAESAAWAAHGVTRVDDQLVVGA